MPFNDHIFLKVRRSALPKDAVNVGLDAGGSLTKAAFIRKLDNDENSEFVTLELTYFHNNDFAEALKFIKENALLNVTSDKSLPATGATTTKNHDLIREILGFGEIATFNEFNSHIFGMSFLVRNFEDDDFCDPTSDYLMDALAIQTADLALQNELMQVRQETFRYTEERQIVSGLAADERGRFPFLMIMAGSGNGNFIIDANNDMVMITGTFKAGKSLIGLTGTLFDITKNHYIELCSLADKGELKPVTKPQHEAKDQYDRLNNAVESEFPFSALDGKKETLALALVRDFAEEQAYAIAMAVARTNVKNVYYGGGMALSAVMRREIYAAVQRYHMKDVNFRFLKTNCTGALGAMVNQNELHAEARKVAEMMKAAAAAAAASSQQAPAATNA